jgi:hypothetical protein
MRRRFLPLLALSIIIALGLSALPGCCCPFFQSYNNLKKLVPVGTVSGTVFAGDPKQPVSGAVVVIADQSTTTDAQGKFKLENVVATNQTITVTSGDLKWTGTVSVTKDGDVNLPEILLSAISPPPDTTGTYPATAEDVIRAYYQAVNKKDYVAATTYLAGQMPVTVDTVKAQYDGYIKNVSVAAIERKASMDYNGRSIYEVTFNAEYIKHYPAGSGDLPTVHAMQQISGQWKIVDIGTG